MSRALAFGAGFIIECLFLICTAITIGFWPTLGLFVALRLAHSLWNDVDDEAEIEDAAEGGEQ